MNCSVFTVNMSVALSVFILMYKYTSMEVHNILITPKGDPRPVKQFSPFPSPSSPWWPPTRFLSLWIC